MPSENQEDVIAYIVGPDHDAVTVCADCAEIDGKDYGEIRDNDAYGDQIPYPECWVCEEVARPKNLSSVDQVQMEYNDQHSRDDVNDTSTTEMK